LREGRPRPARDGRRKVLLISASHYQPDGSVARVRRFFPPAPRNLKIQMHYLTANLIFRKMQQAGKHPYLY
jgi:hypothetical protein